MVKEEVVQKSKGRGDFKGGRGGGQRGRGRGGFKSEFCGECLFEKEIKCEGPACIISTGRSCRIHIKYS